jgi:hypothetical protein
VSGEPEECLRKEVRLVAERLAGELKEAVLGHQSLGAGGQELAVLRPHLPLKSTLI